AQHVEAYPRNDRCQPSAQVLDTARCGAAEPQPGFLDGVVRLGQRAEHPVGYRPQMVLVLHELLRQPVCFVHRSHSSRAARHRHDERNRSDVTRRCAFMSTVTASAAPTRGHTIAYWVTTVLVAAEALVGGPSDVLQARYVAETMEHLGYPAYFTV